MEKLFDIPEEVTYLNCAYMGPMLKSSAEVAMKMASSKMHPWEMEISDFFDPVEKVRELFAKIINSSSENIAIIPSVSYGVAQAVKNLSGLESGEIIVLEDQFPSNIYSWQELAREEKHQLVTIKRQIGTNVTDQIIDRINGKTRILALSHVHWCDGQKTDLEKISEYIRDKDIALVIDGTQSIGAVEFDIEKIKPDFLVTAGYKWLLGPYTLGLMYVSNKFLNGTPLEQNWINKKDAANFSDLVNYKDEYEPGARRFDMGEKSQFHSMSAMADTLERLNEISVKVISDHCQKLNSKLIELVCVDQSIKTWEDSQRASNILGLYFDDSKRLERIKKKLVEEKIYVSYRGSAMRVSPHLYNTIENVEKLASVIKETI